MGSAVSRQSDAGEREPFEEGASAHVRRLRGARRRRRRPRRSSARPAHPWSWRRDRGRSRRRRVRAGAHVHPRKDCLSAAVARGLARAAKGRVHAIVGAAGGGAEGAGDQAGDQATQGVEPLTTVRWRGRSERRPSAGSRGSFVPPSAARARRSAPMRSWGRACGVRPRSSWSRATRRQARICRRSGAPSPKGAPSRGAASKGSAPWWAALASAALP